MASPTSPATFTTAPRQMGGLTVPLERRFLLWMAPRLPRRIHSDHLTALAFAAMGLAGAAYAAAGVTRHALWFASAALVVNWFGDSLDGTLARVRNQQRPRYGFYVDHVVDAAGIVFLLGGLAVSGYLTPLLAVGLMAAYFLLAIEIYLATYCLGTFHMSVGGIGGTELRLLIIAMNTGLWLWNPAAQVEAAGWSFRVLDPLVALAIVGLLGAFVSTTVAHTKALFLAEPVNRT